MCPVNHIALCWLSYAPPCSPLLTTHHRPPCSLPLVADSCPLLTLYSSLCVVAHIALRRSPPLALPWTPSVPLKPTPSMEKNPGSSDAPLASASQRPSSSMERSIVSPEALAAATRRLSLGGPQEASVACKFSIPIVLVFLFFLCLLNFHPFNCCDCHLSSSSQLMRFDNVRGGIELVV
jgi:hypothetical protein